MIQQVDQFRATPLYHEMIGFLVEDLTFKQKIGRADFDSIFRIIELQEQTPQWLLI